MAKATCFEIFDAKQESIYSLILVLKPLPDGFSDLIQNLFIAHLSIRVTKTWCINECCFANLTYFSILSNSLLRFLSFEQALLIFLILRHKFFVIKF